MKMKLTGTHENSHKRISQSVNLLPRRPPSTDNHHSKKKKVTNQTNIHPIPTVKVIIPEN